MKHRLYIMIGFGFSSFCIKADTPIPTTNANQAVFTSSKDTSPPHYQQFNTSFFSPEAPGYNTPDDDPKFNGVKPITFKPENLSTGKLSHTDQDEDTIGYFWNIQDTDPTLLYPGKARIGNEQYINVVVVDSGKVNHTGDADDVGFTGIENIYQPTASDQQQFNNDSLVKIGSFINRGKLYDLYGQYMATIIPDPEGVEYT